MTPTRDNTIMDYDNYLQVVREMETFTTKELRESFTAGGFTKSDATFYRMLSRMVQENVIRRVRKNVYSMGGGKYMYRHTYSEEAIELASLLHERFTDLRFTILELFQLNSFANHLIGRNTIYVYAEKELFESVFDALKRAYPGSVLRNPTLDEYWDYWHDGMIILLPLISQFPTDKTVFWHECIEKFLVDIIADTVVFNSYFDYDLPYIFDNAFTIYSVNTASLMRYAKRRNADGKIRRIVAAVNERLALNDRPLIEL